MKVVVLGSRGMLGVDVVSAFYEHEVISFSRKELDITNNSDLEKIKEINPDVVINAAAYTDVDKAETHKEEAFAVNADAVKEIAKICKAVDCILIHYSTDYVFDGENKIYWEDAKKNPLNVYGESKSKGEDYIVECCERYYIVRTSWLFGKNGKNFVNTIIDLAQAKDDISVVDDQFGKPSYTHDIALATKELFGKPFGIYHITNEGVCSWYNFAKEVISLSNLKTHVKGISSEDFQRPAKRPLHIELLNTKTGKLINWKTALKAYLSSP